MRNGFAGCIGMVALVLLFTTGAAFSQTASPQPRTAMSWGWNPEPAPDSPQSETTSTSSSPDSAQLGTQAQAEQNTDEQTDKQVKKPTDKLMGDPEGQSGQNLSATSPAADSTGSASSSSSASTSDSTSSSSLSSTTIAVLPPDGISPTGKGGILPDLQNPFQVQTQGLKIGPAYLTSISDSFFYAINTTPGSPTQTYYGNSLAATIVYNKQFGQGNLAIQGKEQFSTSELTPYFNQSVGAVYTTQLTDRWTLNTSATFTYFQNTILANPQYLLVPSNNGLVLQNLFTLQRSSSIYESNAISFDYVIDGRTQVTLSPILGATFLDTGGSGWTSSTQLGGSIGINRDYSSNLTLGGSYSFAHTIATGLPGTPSWNSQSLGISVQYRPAPTWNISGSVAASVQQISGLWTLSPTGSVRASKSFSDGSVIFGAYTRTEATAVLVSTGYYSQSDLGYSRKINQKMNFSVTVGEYKTSDLDLKQNGTHAGSFFTYRFRPNLSLSTGYNYVHQAGAQNLTLSPFVGTTSSFSIGLNWILGSPSQ